MKKNITVINHVIDFGGYSYYIGINGTGKWFYNIVPQDQPAPKGGYYSKEYILKIKQLPDLFPTIVIG